jgi:hypothetical protein
MDDLWRWMICGDWRSAAINELRRLPPASRAHGCSPLRLRTRLPSPPPHLGEPPVVIEHDHGRDERLAQPGGQRDERVGAQRGGSHVKLIGAHRHVLGVQPVPVAGGGEDVAAEAGRAGGGVRMGASRLGGLRGGPVQGLRPCTRAAAAAAATAAAVARSLHAASGRGAAAWHEGRGGGGGLDAACIAPQPCGSTQPTARSGRGNAAARACPPPPGMSAATAARRRRQPRRAPAACRPAALAPAHRRPRCQGRGASGRGVG